MHTKQWQQLFTGDSLTCVSVLPNLYRHPGVYTNHKNCSQCWEGCGMMLSELKSGTVRDFLLFGFWGSDLRKMEKGAHIIGGDQYM